MVLKSEMSCFAKEPLLFKSSGLECLAIFCFLLLPTINPLDFTSY